MVVMDINTLIHQSQQSGEGGFCSKMQEFKLTSPWKSFNTYKYWELSTNTHICGARIKEMAPTDDKLGEAIAGRQGGFSAKEKKQTVQLWGRTADGGKTADEM